MSKHILYIEDDDLDIRNMEWLVDQVRGIQLTVSKTFDKVQSLLEASSFDLIITDQYVNGIHYSNSVQDFTNLEYYVLSNTKNSLHEGLQYAPIQALKKPLTLSIFRTLFETETITQDSPQDDFFATISDEDQKTKLISLLIKELEIVKATLPNLLHENKIDEMKHLVHKISSKFSLLQMKKTFDLARDIEKELVIDVVSKDKIQLLLQNTNTALTQLKTK